MDNQNPDLEALEVAADEGLRISAYTAEPGTPSPRRPQPSGQLGRYR
jgi:hypothetical protein